MKIKLASWGNRFWAWLIDIILVSAVTNLLFDFLEVWNPQLMSFESIGTNGVFLFLYWTFLEGLKGQSVGKVAMNLKVTDRQGETIDFMTAAVESFGKAFILPLDCLIGWLAMSGEKLRLFNRLSNTIVIKTEYEIPEGIEYEKE